MLFPFCSPGPTWPYPDGPGLNLDWVLRTVKTIIDEVKDIEETISGLNDTVQQYVNAAFADVQAKVDNQLLENLQQIELIKTQLETQMDRLSAQFAKLNAQHIKDISRLEEEIEKIKVDVPPYQNPETGNMESLQDIINFLYLQTFTGWITAGEFDSLNLTAGEFDSKNLTAGEFDRNAKNLLMEG